MSFGLIFDIFIDLTFLIFFDDLTRLSLLECQINKYVKYQSE